jgi:hypothetical protein
VQNLNGCAKTDDRKPTLRKIKRGVLPKHLPTQKHHINFAQPQPKPTQHPTNIKLTTLETFYTSFFSLLCKQKI